MTRIDGNTGGSALPPTNPYHIARAYQTLAPARPAATSRVAGNTPAASVGDVSRAGQLGSVTPAMNVNVRRLVAGVVPGKVDFSGGEARPSGAAIPMYRHPADKNAAAVAVDAGRRIDVQG